ncbi:MAG: protocatechuate 3,4-dioxygenase [Emcibacter sp.]|nr:protocatechuate 3,4-dioxygenase [Emcibacter sp.]
MAEIVSGFLMPHDPLIPSMPDAPPKAQQDACLGAYATIVDRLRAQEVDTVVVIGDDHYTINGPYCIPQAMIGIGDVEGPCEPWLGISRDKIDNNEALAQHIMQHGLDNGVDWTASKALVVDHSVMVPVHYAVRPLAGVRTIPVYINSGMEPLISNSRAYEVGQSIGQAIASWDKAERVAIFGTGGISHWPGMAEMGRVNEPWDRMIMDLIVKGDHATLMELSDADILRDGGNGGLEIKNFICAMGALGQCRGEIIAYEAVPEWVAGCGYMELKAA